MTVLPAREPLWLGSAPVDRELARTIAVLIAPRGRSRASRAVALYSATSRLAVGVPGGASLGSFGVDDVEGVVALGFVSFRMTT